LFTRTVDNLVKARVTVIKNEIETWERRRKFWKQQHIESHKSLKDLEDKIKLLSQHCNRLDEELLYEAIQSLLEKITRQQQQNEDGENNDDNITDDNDNNNTGDDGTGTNATATTTIDS